MKRKISFFAILCMTILACSLSPQAGIFETDRFSFNVPKDWKWGGRDTRLFGSSFQEIVGIRNPKGLFPSANFTILTSPINDEANLEIRISQTYAEIESSGVLSKQEVEVDGFPSYEISYTNNIGEAMFFFRDIWLEKDSVIYVLSFSCLNNSTDSFASTFDQIQGSFSFKD
jgi:hypothetical protein